MAEQGSFDYVIVGAGSAGAVLAARLSEDPQVSVLLLEAGGDTEGADEVNVPLAFYTMFKTKWDWNYTTTAQKQLHGRTTYWPRMKALGGCSSMNAMIYIRGNRADYDAWRDEYGAAGWGYDDVLPYFVKAEGNTRLGSPYHGQSGPLHVEDRRYTHELTQAYVDSAIAWGLKPNDDFNGAEQDGAGLYQVTCKKGRRWSTNEAYLRPVRGRPNLTVAEQAFATRIELDGGGRSVGSSDARATGVTFRHDGRERTVQATREVLLCGGAINSPHLLLLSGIGPAAHLREQGVDAKVDLSGVGANLQDHPCVPLIWESHGSTDLAEYLGVSRLLQWKTTGKGPLASNGAESGAFFRTSEDLAAPDMQVHCAPTAFYDNGFHEPKRPMFSAVSTLVSVRSRGSVRLRSADPTWHPAIDAAYYDDQADLDTILAGSKTIREMCQQGPLGKHLGKTWQMPEDPTDDDLLDHIRTWTQTLYHPVATCAMGSGEDAVVDASLRVRGVEGLRVVDASVMPAVPRGNTNAPTIMVAEKAADMIRDEIRSSR